MTLFRQILNPKSLSSFIRRRRFSSNSPNLDGHWTSNRVRRTFVDYFVSQGCKFVPSSSVVPHDDRSLLFVNAGMNQFKPIFLGTLDSTTDERGSLRLVANSQKCIRAGGKHNDLADVGRDGTHLTFFEMLGNWGFNGQLSKTTACQQALTLLTDIYGLDKNRLVVTYFKGDDRLGLPADVECREIWRALGFPHDRIVGLGMEENFWEMSAHDGPCGPCTEILYCNSSSTPPSVSMSTEIWNIVFISYNKTAGDRLEPLDAMHVDTGMGLERLCCILQNVATTYETDLFRPILERIRDGIGGPQYGGLFGDRDAYGIDTAYRIVADHARMLTVAMADGVTPGTRGINHVLRKIIRSAIYQSMLIATHVSRKQRRKLRLADLCDSVSESLGEAYPELRSNLDNVKSAVSEEQSAFEQLLRKGKRHLGILLSSKYDQVPAADLFDLQQKYGLPVDEIRTMTKKKGLTFDEDELNSMLEEQKETGHGAMKATGVHCTFGRGRTGTMIAAYFVHNLGISANEAIDKIRHIRPWSIETEDQEEAVRQYEEHLRREKSK